MTKLIGHIRNNAVGYIALTVALGGTSYAATSPMATRAQIQNPRVEHVARGPQTNNGNVRAWAVIGPAGRVFASGGKPKVTRISGDPGGYGIRWRVKIGRCDTVATIDVKSSAATETLSLPGNPDVPFTAGYAVASTTTAARGNETFVQTYNQQGQPTPLGFNVTVIC